jgi:hypothetical protein
MHIMSKKGHLESSSDPSEFPYFRFLQFGLAHHRARPEGQPLTYDISYMRKDGVAGTRALILEEECCHAMAVS